MVSALWWIDGSHARTNGRTNEQMNERMNERTDEPGIDAAWARRLKMHTPVSWWEMIASSSLSCSPAGKHEQIMFT